MVIIKQKTLHKYCDKYPEAKIAIAEWADKTESADWAISNGCHDIFQRSDGLHPLVRIAQRV